LRIALFSSRARVCVVFCVCAVVAVVVVSWLC
jgi:hypothetical protein